MIARHLYAVDHVFAEDVTVAAGAKVVVIMDDYMVTPRPQTKLWGGCSDVPGILMNVVAAAGTPQTTSPVVYRYILNPFFLSDETAVWPGYYPAVTLENTSNRDAKVRVLYAALNGTTYKRQLEAAYQYTVQGDAGTSRLYVGEVGHAPTKKALDNPVLSGEVVYVPKVQTYESIVQLNGALHVIPADRGDFRGTLVFDMDTYSNGSWSGPWGRAGSFAVSTGDNNSGLSPNVLHRVVGDNDGRIFGAVERPILGAGTYGQWPGGDAPFNDRTVD